MDFSTTTVCRGCRHEFQVFFSEGQYWRTHEHKVDCPNCDSELLVQCQREMVGVYSRTKMLKHTDKLLKMLSPNYSKDPAQSDPSATP